MFVLVCIVFFRFFLKNREKCMMRELVILIYVSRLACFFIVCVRIDLYVFVLFYIFVKKFVFIREYIIFRSERLCFYFSDYTFLVGSFFSFKVAGIFWVFVGVSGRMEVWI